MPAHIARTRRPNLQFYSSPWLYSAPWHWPDGTAVRIGLNIDTSHTPALVRAVPIGAGLAGCCPGPGSVTAAVGPQCSLQGPGGGRQWWGMSGGGGVCDRDSDKSRGGGVKMVGARDNVRRATRV